MTWISARRAAGVTALVIAAAAGGARAQSAALPVNIGELVHTFQAPNDLGNVVVTLIDTTPSTLAAATPGVNFLAPIFWNVGAGSNEWTSTNLGQVYGVALDRSYPNIYVTAAGPTIYPGAGNAFGPLGGGGVYRLDGATGAICNLASLPNTVNGPGLGNITYSAKTNSLYVSNFEDGLIYRLGLGANTATPPCPLPTTSITTYNHGVAGRVGAGMVAIPDAGTAGTMTAVGRRVWGLAVHPAENRLYYGVWWEDTGTASATQANEVWSVALSATGDPVPSTAYREFTMPPFVTVPTPTSNPIAGLNFTPSNGLLVGERSLGAHQSRLLEYSGATHAWVAAPTNRYLVGVNNTSCSGAGDMDCSRNVWTAGDGIILSATALYGLMRIPAGGNTAASPPYSTGILIDSDEEITQQDKTRIGTLTLLKECSPCRPTPPTPSPLLGSPDERCGVTASNTYHYSIDVFGNPANPGGFVSVGQQNTPTGFLGLHVAVWDRVGNILRQGLFSTSTTNEQIVATSVEADAQCNLLIAGRTLVNGTQATFVTVMDPLFKPVWSRKLPGNVQGGPNVQADWLSDGSIIVSAEDVTGTTATTGRLTRLSPTGALIWSKRYLSTLGGVRRFLFEDVEQAPGGNGNIWVCGAADWPAAGGTFIQNPMIMEVSLATGFPTGAGCCIYQFPANSLWTGGDYNAIKFNPTIGASNGNIVVAGWSTQPNIVAPRIASIVRAINPTTTWDVIYTNAGMIPGNSAISIPAQSFASANNIMIAGRPTISGFQGLANGLTLRVAESNGLTPQELKHGTPQVGRSAYAFTDITPGSYRAMIGGFSDLNPFPGGGSQLWMSIANCPVAFTPTFERQTPTLIRNGEVQVVDEQILPLVLVPQPTICPCATICRQVICSADFNLDGDIGTDADIEDFFHCLAGNCCDTCIPDGADFDGDGDVGTDADIETFFRVLAGGSCT